jgi:hypothetical protein
LAESLALKVQDLLATNDKVEVFRVSFGGEIAGFW